MKRGGTILVTGAAGLVGNRIYELLVEDGRRVLPVDQVPATSEGRPITRVGLTDIHRLHSIMHQEPITGIIHCGACSGPMLSTDNPTSIVDVNIVGTANMLELARVYGGIRVVNCSSISAYGPVAGNEIPEDIPLRPTTVYAASKAGGEHLAGSYAAQYGVDAVSIRLGWVFGSRRTTDCVIRETILNALSGLPTTLMGGNEAYRQYLYVDDAARALILAMDAASIGKIAYNVTGNSYITIAEMAQTIRSFLPEADIAISEDVGPYEEAQGRFSGLNAASDPGYLPKISFSEGVRRYIEWLSARSFDARANAYLPGKGAPEII
jgi:UDP-glucuronate 4-epimerase